MGRLVTVLPDTDAYLRIALNSPDEFDVTQEETIKVILDFLIESTYWGFYDETSTTPYRPYLQFAGFVKRVHGDFGDGITQVTFDELHPPRAFLRYDFDREQHQALVGKGISDNPAFIAPENMPAIFKDNTLEIPWTCRIRKVRPRTVKYSAIPLIFAGIPDIKGLITDKTTSGYDLALYTAEMPPADVEAHMAELEEDTRYEISADVPRPQPVIEQVNQPEPAAHPEAEADDTYSATYERVVKMKSDLDAMRANRQQQRAQNMPVVEEQVVAEISTEPESQPEQELSSEDLLEAIMNSPAPEPVSETPTPAPAAQPVSLADLFGMPTEEDYVLDDTAPAPSVEEVAEENKVDEVVVDEVIDRSPDPEMSVSDKVKLDDERREAERDATTDRMNQREGLEHVALASVSESHDYEGWEDKLPEPLQGLDDKFRGSKEEKAVAASLVTVAAAESPDTTVEAKEVIQEAFETYEPEQQASLKKTIESESNRNALLAALGLDIDALNLAKDEDEDERFSEPDSSNPLSAGIM